jgi:hypothetical protein
VRGARVTAAVVGLVLLALAAAVLVREVALAVDDDLEWTLTPWRDLTTAATVWQGLAAAVLAVTAAALFVVAVRLVVPPARPVVEFGEGGVSTRTDLATLQRLLTRQLERSVPGLKVTRLWLDDETDGWRVWVLADAPWVDLEGVRRRAAGAAAEELRRAGGLRLRRLDLEIDHISVPKGGSR